MGTMINLATQTSNMFEITQSVGSLSGLFDEAGGNNAMDSTPSKKHDFASKQLDCIKELQREIASLLARQNDSRHSVDGDTALALSQLCREIQGRNEQHLQRLEILAKAIDIRTGESESTNSRSSKKDAMKWHTSGPLESVQETEIEMDDSSYKDVSKAFFSPLRMRQLSEKQSVRTPATPIMNSFSSNSSSPFQDQEAKSDESVEHASSSRKPTGNECDLQSHLQAFHEDDDMITLDTRCSMNTANGPLGRSNGRPSNASGPHGRSNAAAPRSSVKKGKNSASRTGHGSTHSSSNCDNQQHLNLQGGTADQTRDSRIDESRASDPEESVDDDSTNMVATVLASMSPNNHQNRQGFRPIDDSRPRNPVAWELERRTPVFRPTQIYVDTAASSPDQTNLTMDATVMHEEFMEFSLNIGGDEDGLSVATPILDRYRLDADDCTVGVKVVPNKRGSSRIHKRNPDPRPSDEDRRNLQTPFSKMRANRTDLFTPMTERTPSSRFSGALHARTVNTPRSLPAVLPSFVSDRKKKSYRTTPHPKKNPGEILNFDEENVHPNESTDDGLYFVQDAASPFQPVPSKSFRAKSLQSLRARTGGEPNYERSGGSLACSTSTGAFNLVDQNDPLQELDASTIHKSTLDSIERISITEFESAPNVVRTQVDVDDVNKSIEVIEDAIRSGKCCPRLHEQEAYELLKSISDDERKVKSLLMSMCHWRRLLMQRDGGGQMMFEVNDF